MQLPDLFNFSTVRKLKQEIARLNSEIKTLKANSKLDEELVNTHRKAAEMAREKVKTLTSELDTAIERLTHCEGLQRENEAARFTLTTLADALGVSRSTAYRAYREIYGDTGKGRRIKLTKLQEKRIRTALKKQIL